MKKKRFLKKDLDLYREKLINLRDDLVSKMRDIAENSLKITAKEASGDISSYSIHMADAASDNYEREFNFGLVSNGRNVVIEIDQALKRIEEGTYGTCKVCQKKIAKKRLNAVPHAAHCLKCQEEHEKKADFHSMG